MQIIKPSVLIAVGFALLPACRPAPPPSAAASAEVLIRALDGNDGQALWDQLPPSMKAELADVLRDIRGQVGAPLARVGDGFVAESARALGQQLPRLSQFGPLAGGMKSSADRQAFAEGLAGTLRHLSQAPLYGTEDPRAIADRAGPSLLRMLIPALRIASPDLVDGKSLAGQMVQVDGRWIPVRWSLAWQQARRRMRPLLQAGPEGPLRTNTVQIIRLVNQSRARLARLVRARDQAAFDDALSLVAGSLSLALSWASTPLRG